MALVNSALFFEEDAFLPDGTLKQAKERSINKIGHALHDLDPVFSQFSRTPKPKQLIFEIGIEKPLLLQSMYIFKQPNIGGEVTCHQDSSFLYTEPTRIVGLWFALESLANRSRKSRQAYTLHVIDASSRYPSDNWLQRPTMLCVVSINQ